MAGYPNLGSISGGMLDAQLDMQNIQLNQAKIAEAPIKLEQDRISLIRDKISLAQDMKMLSLMQNLRLPEGASTPTDPSAMAGILDQMSMIELQSGKVDAAAKTAGEAARLRDTSSKVDYRSYRMRNDRLSKFANVLGSTPDTPEGFKQAVAAMMASDPSAARDQKFQQIAQMQWRLGLVPALQRSVLTAKEQAEVNYRRAAEKHANAAAAADDARVPLIKAQTKRQLEWLKDHEKEGGKDSVYKAEELRTITDMASVDYPGADPADIRVRARQYVIMDAKKMVRTDSITFPEAARRAYEQARTSGAFSGLRQMPAPKGTKAGVPMPLPQAKDEKDFEKKLQENQWYDIDGTPQLYMGGKFYTEEELGTLDKEDRDELGGDNDGDIFPEERTDPEDEEPAVER